MFQKLKKQFSKKLIIKWFNPQLKIVIKINILDRALGAYFSQYHKKILYLVTFHSRKFSPAELNYNIYNKKLLAIVNTFK